MHIETIPSGPFETNTYILSDTNGVAAIIDPTFGATLHVERVIASKGYHVVEILLTHSHLDHIAEVAECKKIFPVPVAVHPLDAPNLQSPGCDGLPLPFSFPGVEPDYLFKDGEVRKLGLLEYRIIHTPGHSPGGVVFYFEAEKVLISGDTLFRGAMGNLSFPTAEPKKMVQSLKKLAELPSDVVVYPGHGLATTIGEEKWIEQADRMITLE